MCDVPVCKSDSEVAVCDVRVPLNLGTVASDSNVVIRPARRGSKVKHRFKKLRIPSGSGIKERTGDSIESFESVSCSKPSISSSAGSEEVKVTAPGDCVLDIESNGNFGLCRDVDSHIFRNSNEAIQGDHSVVVSENGGGRVLSSVRGNLSFLPENHSVSSGAIGRGILQEHSSNAVGDRVEGKKIRRVELTSGDLSFGKGRQAANSDSVKNLKTRHVHISNDGRGCSFSGSHSTCYGEQSEESDIRRNNNRQWEFLKRDVGDRLWEAMLALGVVDSEGRKPLIHSVVPGCEGRKEVKKIVQ